MAQSQVARLLQQIAEEYIAAQNALTGFAYGTTRHDFITVRMENMFNHQQELQTLVGEQATQKLLIDCYNQL